MRIISAMNLKQIEKKIDRFNFQVFPQMLVQVHKVTSDESSSAQDLADIVLKDQALTTKILSIANSAYYGFYGKISTITQAIVVLGFASVKNIAFGLIAYNSLSKLIKEPLLKNFWEHSLATGVCAELLAEKIGYQPTEEALVGGLIHDVGKLMMVQFYPDEYGEVERIMNEQPDAYSHVVETSILGVNHCEVGRLLARKWGLPGPLQQVIADHHKKNWGQDTLTDIVGFSDFVIGELPDSSDGERLERLINMGASVLSLKKESIQNVLQILAERLEEYCRIFEIPIENLTAYTTMMQQEYERLKKSPESKTLSRKEEEVSILSEISNAMLSGQSEDDILQMVLEGVIRINGAGAAILFAVDREHAALRGRKGLGRSAAGITAAFAFSLSDAGSPIVRALNAGQPITIARPEGGGLPAAPEQEILAELGAGWAEAIPLRVKDSPVGLMLVAWEGERSGAHPPDHQSLSLFANQAALALSRIDQEEPAAEQPKKKRSSLLLDLD